MNQFDVRIAFPSGLAKSYLDCSFDYPLRLLIPFKVIAKASKTSGILKPRNVDHENKLHESCSFA